MTYKHFPNRPNEVTAEFIMDEYSKIIDRIGEAEASETPDAWLELYSDWNALKSFISSEGSRRSYALSKDMNDTALEEADKYFREKIAPAADNGESTLVNALLGSVHKLELGQRYGTHLVEVLETTVEPLAPVNNAIRVECSDLVNQYDKLVAAGEVVIQGKTVTLAVARSLQSSEDPDTRKAAYIAYREWLLKNRNALAALFDGLVKRRDTMGKNLGHKNFIPLGYNAMGRTDYGEKEAAQFRENVRTYAVPLLKKLHERQAAAIGTPTLRPWDSGYDPEFSLPSGIAPVDNQIDNAQKVFDALSPRLGNHFRRMRDEELIDLENRKGKRAGAFCTSFPDEGRVAIFCNSTGDEDDVRTLMHEMGHAFQGWESQPIEAVDLQWPTSDACEVHSMGMEYLSMRHIDHFFNAEHTLKFRRGRWKGAVALLCYVCIVDEFQHWVYENPNATPDERDQAWNRISDTYQPDIDYSGVEQYKHVRWYAQGHVYWMPFYYIDYAIAETGAMQLALMDAQNHEQALDTYIKLCQMGGTKSVLNIFTSSGLRSPFAPEVMRDLMAHAAKELGVN